MSVWAVQAVRYVIVGAISNAALYCFYLLLTGVGVGHKSAMSLLYGVGVVQTFYFQRRWTFSHSGRLFRSLNRYVLAYALCYLGNLAALYWFVDALGWRHEVVQAGNIVVSAVLLFLIQKIWVFRAHSISPTTMGN
ncbi:MAG: GtrA family protein [Methylocystis sp.]|uniref:GtrA family protein n=1 Tax=Methylocystis sp. TaxID=1911079 RepID=UPI003DA6832A